MREETGEWLDPMLTEANARGIDTRPLMRQASMPVAESDNQFLEELATVVPAVKGIDWVRFGQLLRHELGWCETYPPHPDFPELRDVP